EAKTGKRLARVSDRRTKLDYAAFMKELAAAYPQAEKIRVVQDNLNTHSTSAFYESFSAEEAFALSQRFEFYYTPKSASWLNMIEIEFSALSKQCLNRRIATKEELTKEVLAIVKEREEKAVKIDWQFSIESARGKLNRHYREVNADNAQYQKTWECQIDCVNGINRCKLSLAERNDDADYTRTLRRTAQRLQVARRYVRRRWSAPTTH